MPLHFPVTDRFTEAEERALLALYFTAPGEDISFVIGGWDFGPEEQAAEAAKYSRTHVPYQERILKQLAKEPALDMDFVRELTKNPALGSISLLKRAKQLTGQFHLRWSLGVSEEERDTAVRDYGHNSIKEAANCLYVCENILDLDNKIISGDPLNSAQVKSSRYIDWTALLSRQESNPDIAASLHGDLLIKTLRTLSEAYVSFTDRLKDTITGSDISRRFFNEVLLSPEQLNQTIKQLGDKRRQKDPGFTINSSTESELRNEAVVKLEKYYSDYALKSVFDSTRYFLTPAMLTSMAVASDARTVERNITALLSAPLRSANLLGEKLRQEGKKIMPSLLGDHSHAKRSDYIVELREQLRRFAKARFPFETAHSYEKGNRTSFLGRKLLDAPWDLQAAVYVMFEHSHGSLSQLAKHFDQNSGDVNAVCDIINNCRGRFDPLPAGLGHVGQTTHETLMDYGGYRDLHRHRRGARSRQLITAAHGFEIPDLVKMGGLEDEFSSVMEEARKAFLTVEATEPDVAQLIVPFAFRHRTIYSWSLEQHGYVSELRGRPSANPSYQHIAWDLYDMIQEEAPIFGKLVRVDKIDYPADLINLKEAREWYDAEVRALS